MVTKCFCVFVVYLLLEFANNVGTEGPEGEGAKTFIVELAAKFSA